jgi:hypothetical protein
MKAGVFMSEEWILKAATIATENHGLVILENPALKKKLDEILLEIWPQIKSHLDTTGLIFEPEELLSLETEFSSVMVRSLTFMLFEAQSVFCRTKIECMHDHWMIYNEFFLSLSEKTDIKIVQEILGNSRFSGNPPTLMIYKNDKANYFQITFNSGLGEGWGIHDNLYLLDKIKRSIDTHVRMQKLMLDGISDVESAEEFLSTTYELYESD